MDRAKSHESESKQSIYDWIIQAESKPAFPDDAVMVNVDEPAAKQLADWGVEWEENAAERGGAQVNFFLEEIPRENLLKAGIVFINRISRDNEKPILAGKMVLPDGEAVQLEDFQFLTESDLQQVLEYQEEKRGRTIDFEAVRKAACQFTEDAVRVYNDRNKTPQEFVESVYEEIADELDEEDRQKLEEYRHPKTKREVSVFEHSYFYYLLELIEKTAGSIKGTEDSLRDAFNARFPRLSQEHPEFLEEVIERIYRDPANWKESLKQIPETQDIETTKTWTPSTLLMLANIDNKLAVRGVQFDVTPVRSSALQGLPSPFLDSGFVFERNHDITIHFPDGRVRRLNTAVLHLWSRGLDEMGGSRDQIYITAEEFQELMELMESESGDGDKYSKKDRNRLKKYIKSEVFMSDEDREKREKESNSIMEKLRRGRD